MGDGDARYDQRCVFGNKEPIVLVFWKREGNHVAGDKILNCGEHTFFTLRICYLKIKVDDFAQSLLLHNLPF